MDLSRLLAELSQPRAFPESVDAVHVYQTHISVVFVAGSFAYKIRKPVQLPFLDFSTFPLRHADCLAELELNRRFAPGVYLGVVPITQSPDGLRWEGAGEVVEYAVKMRRLDPQLTLEQAVLDQRADTALMQQLGQRLAGFHQTARRTPGFAGRETVSQNLRANLELSTRQIGQTVSRTCWDRLSRRLEEALATLGPLVDQRSLAGWPRETHGDLHLDHVYLQPDAPPAEQIVLVDCIEFNERFRCIDPIADMAFLAMDLKFHGRRDLARDFQQAYFAHAADPDGPQLLNLYSSYRAAVRAKVEGLLLQEPEVPVADRDAAALRARGHWLLALGELEPPATRPGLLLVGGLPGSGKSSLARQLATHSGFTVLRSDVLRKQLAGLDPAAPSPTDRRAELYSPDMTRRTYAECLRQAADLLWEGQRVCLDATFASEAFRAEAFALADRHAVACGWLLCEAPAAVIQQRLAARTHDASDADWQVYLQAVTTFEAAGPATARRSGVVETSHSPAAALAQAQAFLATWELGPAPATAAAPTPTSAATSR